MIHISEKNLTLNGGCAFADFELDAYAQLDVEVFLEADAVLELALGEVAQLDRVNRSPGGYRIIRTMQKACPAGKSSFAFDLPKHKSPYPYTLSVDLPPEAGKREITPFRYVEIVGGKGTAKLIRKAFYGNFDDSASDFRCDNSCLNRIWDFCKYSMKATSAFGLYIDGERERQPYEGDALSNMLGDLCCGGSPETARRTIEWLLKNPTWFTEWQLIIPMLVWEYRLYSGNQSSVDAWLPELEKLMQTFAVQENDLLRDAPADECRIKRCCRNLIDWPPAERDNYVLGKFNLTPNCYFYQSLLIMYKLTGKLDYQIQAGRVLKAIERNFRKNNLWVDSIGSDHTALHSLLYPAYFKIALADGEMKNLLRSKGMACSVFTAQFLLEYCFDNGLTDHAFDLLLSDDLRSWNNMLDKGATIAMEAWDDSLKPNQDWNHAWGAAPANLIPRCIAGIKPLEPGFRKFVVKPHPGKLKEFYCKHPTPAGAIELEYKNNSFKLKVPQGLTAVTPSGESQGGVITF